MANTGRVREGEDPPRTAPHRVRAPVNLHEWKDITFLHWPFDPGVVAALVPDELDILTHEGAAWVSLTPFLMRVRPPAVPTVPPGWQFPETNLRTYVRSRDGREGLWFLRMEVSALWFVATLRILGLPYFHQRMGIRRSNGSIVYRSRPRSATGGGGHDVVVRPGEPLLPSRERALDRFVTARWVAFHRRGPILMRTPVEHGSWPLRSARVEGAVVVDVFRSAGLEAPGGPPVVHFSSGVTVRVGAPRVVTSA